METVDEGTIHLSIIGPCGELHVPDPTFALSVKLRNHEVFK